MDPTYLALGAAVLAVWLPNVRLAGISVAPWSILLAAAVVLGMSAGVLTWPALLPLGALCALTAIVSRSEHGGARSQEVGAFAPWRWIAIVAYVGLALALALHLLPGFNNPTLVARVSLSPDAVPFTQYLNFDKGAAGLLLIVTCRRWTGAADIRRTLPATLVALLATPTLVLGVALATGFVRPDVKLPSFALAFLATNLVFTCVAEEAFFRGQVQARVRRLLPDSAGGLAFSILLSAALFGMAHFGGGITAVVLASLAGLAYAAVYAATGRVEPAILTHFAVNAIHFVAFTYPQLAAVR